jgi:hypothetical protein
MDFSSRRGEAQSLVKEANKLANPSFLGMRMKGDWLGATPLYERAALLFRVRCKKKQSGCHNFSYHTHSAHSLHTLTF